MGRGGPAFPHAGAVVLTAILLLAGGLSISASPPRSAGLRELVAVNGSGPIHAYVTWNGANASSAGTDSSALSTNFASTITLHYVWSSPALYNISDARLQMFYFGFALSTRDVVDTNPVPADNGSFTMTWQAGAIDYLLEGNYRLTATLLTPSGVAEWSQSFYVRAAAPFDVLAAIPILLILIGLYEVYGLLTAGRPPATPPKAAARSPANGGGPAAEATEGADGRSGAEEGAS